MHWGAGQPSRAPSSHGSLLFLNLAGGLNNPKNSFQKMAFRQSAFEKLLSVYHRPGNSLDAIEGNKVRKFRSLNTVSRNLVALHCKLVSQAYRPRTMRSSGRDKNLKVNRLAQLGKLLFALGCERGFAF